MSAQEHSLLIWTNGAQKGLHALDYGVWLAGLLQLPVTLLGVVEKPTQGEVVEQALDATQAQLEAAGIEYTVQLRSGPARGVVPALAVPEQHLVVVGPLGRPWWKRWLRGHSLRRMMAALRTPFIYVPTAHRQLARILVATGALHHAESAEYCALDLARRTGAGLTFLYVAEAAGYSYPTAAQMDVHWRDLLTTDTPQARHLRSLLEQARTQGVEPVLHVRHGTVVREILAEAHEGDCDLVVMGSKHSSNSLRRYYVPDVAAGVMEALDRPVLVVEEGQPCILGYRQRTTEC
jgi:nucleotide-binding universal stress UspA family protein